jgi:predicted nucleotidyltransferase
MIIGGTVAEFNPFHNGHASFVTGAREKGITHLIAVMSGNFVQRGEPAILPAPVRARAALECGVDLILQLPVTYALSGARGFARGAVEILDACGVCEKLVFGSECGNADILGKTASLIESKEVNEKIRAYLETGMTYASARENAVREIDPAAADIIKYPNNILGVEYIGALSEISSSIEAVTVARTGAMHDSPLTSGEIAGGMEIRRMMLEGENADAFLPDVYHGRESQNIVSLNKFETAVLCRMRTISTAELALAPDVSEGIENRISACAVSGATLDEMYGKIKTKRYTLARIRRIIVNAFLGITAEDAAIPVPYLRVIGFNDRGAEIIRMMKENASLPIVSKTADIAALDERAKRIFSLECRATDVYSACLTEPVNGGAEKDFSPVIV